MTADPMIHCGRGICATEEGHAGTCDEASGWAEEESDVRPVSPAQDAVSDAEAAEWERLAGEATEPVTATCIACGTRVPIDQSCPQCRATRATRARRARLRAATA